MSKAGCDTVIENAESSIKKHELYSSGANPLFVEFVNNFFETLKLLDTQYLPAANLVIFLQNIFPIDGKGNLESRHQLTLTYADNDPENLFTKKNSFTKINLLDIDFQKQVQVIGFLNAPNNIIENNTKIIEDIFIVLEESKSRFSNNGYGYAKSAH